MLVSAIEYIEFMTDLYEVLEVEKSSSVLEIKRAFRQKAKRLHPDVNNDLSAHDDIILVMEAYEILGNDHARRLYDRKISERVHYKKYGQRNTAKYTRTHSYEHKKDYQKPETRKVEEKKFISKELFGCFLLAYGIMNVLLPFYIVFSSVLPFFVKMIISTYGLFGGTQLYFGKRIYDGKIG